MVSRSDSGCAWAPQSVRNGASSSSSFVLVRSRATRCLRFFPPISYEFRSTQRRTTLSPSLWVRQEISPRFSMVYLGGVAFGRTNNEVEISYSIGRSILPIAPIPSIAPIVNESITYDVQPMVGVEGRIRMGGKVDLVPGLRLHGAQGGWLIRPAVGLSWNF